MRRLADHRLPPRPSMVILTGAGISRESGLHTFRDKDGIWNQVRLEDVATPEAFQRDPAKVQGFYNARRAQLQDPAIQPNAAHRALAELEKHWPGAFLLVTQNVDNLHDRAGSRKLRHMHGELNSVWCPSCDHRQAWTADLTGQETCPSCDRQGSLRPDIVWFGEMPYFMDQIYAALADADIFVSIGTSGTVYPAAGFVAEARAAGALTIELNLEDTDNPAFRIQRHGPATELVPAFVAEALAAIGTL